MFGSNEIVGKKFFDNANGKLFVTSIFATLQGEGPYQGRPAIFVRLAKCNLACSFCDTFFDDGDWFDPDELAAVIYNRAKDKFPADMTGKIGVVITGGEPSLQQLGSFLHMLETVPFAFVQIESNGILFPDGLPQKTTLVVSPKCLERNGRAVMYLSPNDHTLARANCLKFVMSADPDTPYHKVPDWALEWREESRRPIYVSPMNMYQKLPEAAVRSMISGKRPTIAERSEEMERISFWEPGLLDMKLNKLNHEYAARYALEHGLNLTLQMHLFASLA